MMTFSACGCGLCLAASAEWTHTVEPCVAQMRKLGIVHMARGDMTITLGPPPPPVVPPVDEAAAIEERIAHEKPGPDGLTPSEQADLYGTPFEKG